MRRLTREEWMALVLAGARIRDEVDRDVGLLVIAVAQGDDTALIGLADRLRELGRDAEAERVAGLEG